MEETKVAFGYYTVNRLGQIWSKSGRPVKGTKNSKGYYQTTNSEKQKYLIHRIVAMAWLPNPENKPHVNHIDGNKTNNCVDNLEWCTIIENNRHAVQIGLHSSRQVQVQSYYIPTKTTTIHNSIIGASRESGVNEKTLGSGLKRKHPHPYITSEYTFQYLSS